MTNYEYAQATDEQLQEWAWVAYQNEIDEAYEERVERGYEARGQGNLY